MASQSQALVDKETEQHEVAELLRIVGYLERQLAHRAASLKAADERAQAARAHAAAAQEELDSVRDERERLREHATALQSRLLAVDAAKVEAEARATRRDVEALDPVAGLRDG